MLWYLSSSHISKEKVVKISVTEGSRKLEMMDDFLEIERLACLPSQASCHCKTVEKMKINNAETALSGLT
jgi:hypothetical protein